MMMSGTQCLPRTCIINMMMKTHGKLPGICAECIYDNLMLLSKDKLDFATNVMDPNMFNKAQLICIDNGCVHKSYT